MLGRRWGEAPGYLLGGAAAGVGDHERHQARRNLGLTLVACVRAGNGKVPDRVAQGLEVARPHSSFHVILQAKQLWGPKADSAVSQRTPAKPPEKD